MSAVLRVWWTFFTALRLQRWLGGIGLVLCALLTLAGLVAGQPFWIAGLVMLFTFAVFPTLFASPAVFRALSASHANQLLPHFRARMLGAVALFVAALLATTLAPLLLSVSASAGRQISPFQVAAFELAFATAIFLIMFLQFGNWRWMWLWIGASLGFSSLLAWPPGRSALAALPVSTWLGAVLVAWVTFGAWYLRARRIHPLVLVPQPPAGAWTRAKLDRPLTRAAALHALITANPPGARLAPGTLVGVLIVAAAVIFLVIRAARIAPFTAFIWAFALMIGCWAVATSVVHRSRLLWLRLPGPRETVRREVERALCRIFGRFVLALLVLAALYASPLVGTAPLIVLAGFALAASAGLFGIYAAFAAVPGGALHISGFAVLMALQLGLLARPAPSLTSVVIVTAVELAGALFFRALALRRWRHIDWTRVRPLPASLLRAR